MLVGVGTANPLIVVSSDTKGTLLFVFLMGAQRSAAQWCAQVTMWFFDAGGMISVVLLENVHFEALDILKPKTTKFKSENKLMKFFLEVHLVI